MPRFVKLIDDFFFNSVILSTTGEGNILELYEELSQSICYTRYGPGMGNVTKQSLHKNSTCEI